MRYYLLYFLPLFLLAIKHEPITPIPQTIKYNKQKALLGKELFFDSQFSSDKTISCASCHLPKYGGADPRKVSIGVFGRLGEIQSPTVYNAVYNFRQFWNGRAYDLKEQIMGPTHNPVEMGMNKTKIEKILNSNKKYKKKFFKIYKTDKITFDMFAEAIAEFETTLITPNCKFDRWLRDEVKLTKLEKDGYMNFKKLGCINCHNGVNIGGNSFQKIGIIHPLKERWEDRYVITKNPNDKNVYKVPTLRNIELTSPYFHNGLVYGLDEAINKMAHFNLGLELSEYQVKSIKAFLKTLTGETPTMVKDIK